MRSNFIYLFLFLSLSFKQGDQELLWQSSKKLTWENFKSKPNSNDTPSAVTDSRIKIDYFSKKDSLYVVIKTIMAESRSWVKEKYKSKALLNHEQVHFDIAEINARKLRKTISLLKISKINVKQTMTNFKDSTVKKLILCQDRYDLETNHGRNKKQQIEWEKIVAKELKVLEQYKNPEIKILLSKN